MKKKIYVIKLYSDVLDKQIELDWLELTDKQTKLYDDDELDLGELIEEQLDVRYCNWSVIEINEANIKAIEKIAKELRKILK